MSVIAEYQKLLELRASKIEKLESEIRDTIHNRTPRSVEASHIIADPGGRGPASKSKCISAVFKTVIYQTLIIDSFILMISGMLGFGPRDATANFDFRCLSHCLLLCYLASPDYEY